MTSRSSCRDLEPVVALLCVERRLGPGAAEVRDQPSPASVTDAHLDRRTSGGRHGRFVAVVGREILGRSARCASTGPSRSERGFDVPRHAVERVGSLVLGDVELHQLGEAQEQRDVEVLQPVGDVGVGLRPRVPDPPHHRRAVGLALRFVDLGSVARDDGREGLLATLVGKQGHADDRARELERMPDLVQNDDVIERQEGDGEERRVRRRRRSSRRAARPTPGRPRRPSRVRSGCREH